MKTVVRLLIVGMFVCFNSFLYAQNSGLNYGTGKDSIVCTENLAVYSFRYKNEEATGAFSPETYKAWRAAFTICPQGSKNMYVPHGIKMFTPLCEKATDPVVKQKYLDTIMMIYDRRIQYFGEEALYLGYKGADLYNLKPEAYNEAYPLLLKSVETLGNKANVKAIIVLMQVTLKKVEDKSMTKVEALAQYQKLAAIMDYNIANGSKSHEKMMPYLEEMFLSLKPSCEDLIGLFEPQFTANPENVDLLKKITKNLSSNCSSTDLYLKAAVSLDKLEPSATSKRNIAEMYVAKNQISVAVDYFTQAIELETDANNKAEIYYRIASLYNNSPNTCVNYLNKAISLKPDMARLCHNRIDAV